MNAPIRPGFSMPRIPSSLRSLLRSSLRSLTFAAALLPTLQPALAGARQDAAAERAAYAKLPVCRLGADGKSLEIEPCRTAPAQRPMPRRPVPRQDHEEHIGLPDTTPRPVLPSATLEPRSPGAAPYPTTPAPPVPPAINPATPGTPANPYLNPAPGAFATPQPSRPSPTTCVGATCRDAAGNTFQQGGTGVTRSPTGRHCTTVGGFVRCM